MNPRRYFWIVCLLLVSGWLFADEQDKWRVELQVEAGNEASWVSPGPVGVNYLRFYQREDFTFKIEARLVFWIPVVEETGTTFTELEGPIPPEGLVIYEDSITVQEDTFTAEAIITLRVDGDGYVRLEVTDFTSTLPLRVTVTGWLKVLQTDTVFGDMNGNGHLDQTDAARLRAWLAERPGQYPPATTLDLDNNGRVEANDVLMIQHFVLGNLFTAYMGWNF
jgi:hypothetical protein